MFLRATDGRRPVTGAVLARNSVRGSSGRCWLNLASSTFEEGATRKLSVVEFVTLDATESSSKWAPKAGVQTTQESAARQLRERSKRGPQHGTHGAVGALSSPAVPGQKSSIGGSPSSQFHSLSSMN
jgi:hypothetical protein